MRPRIRYLLIVLALVAAAVGYKCLDPSVVPIFPRCPFRLLTGYLCPGCGSQRAIHHLLNFNLAAAWRMNPLFVIALPYLALVLLLKPLSHRSPRCARLRDLLLGYRASVVILVVILLFWVGRNIVA